MCVYITDIHSSISNTRAAAPHRHHRPCMQCMHSRQLAAAAAQQQALTAKRGGRTAPLDPMQESRPQASQNQQARVQPPSELIEIRLVNRRYTWSNGRANPTLVHLDWAFCNRAWDSAFPPLSLTLSSSLSDHCPLLLCKHQLPPRRAVFRFE
jgi:hypothetical protein